jgi:DNA-directed RNA polymerase subunit RPC12/RpoP
MNLLEFNQFYPDEASCKQKFKEIREREGIICSRCGSTEYYWKKDKEQFECKKCKHRTTLKSGTVMHKSKLPFRHWFIAMHLLSSTKKTFSAKEIQRQIGHKRYQPIWEMLHKIRHAMGKRDDRYNLSGELELDDGFFTTVIPDDQKNEELKRGRGSQKKTKVLVMAESEREENPKKNKKSRRVGYLKMKVIPDLKSKTIDLSVDENISGEASIVSDASTSYIGLKDKVKNHTAKVIRNDEIIKELPWVHIAISNAKRWILNMFHSVHPEYLQSYLNEFCYRFNRRYFGNATFDRLVTACVSSKNEFRYI